MITTASVNTDARIVDSYWLYRNGPEPDHYVSPWNMQWSATEYLWFNGDWKAKPGVATNKDEVLAAAGSRYTYSANTLAMKEAKERGVDRLALVLLAQQLDLLVGGGDGKVLGGLNCPVCKGSGRLQF